MPDALSISKSVARAFRLLELFREQRRPMTAAEIGRRLALPQPSARALVKNLLGIGYLAYDSVDRTYVPTARVAALGDWLPTSPAVSRTLLSAVGRIAQLADETTSVCGIRDGNVEILHVVKASHPVALQLEPGVGVALWRTSVGRTLLAQMPPETLAPALERMLKSERTVAGRRALQDLPRELRKIAATGSCIGYDLFLKGVGAICVPVPAEAGRASPIVIAVAGLKERIRPREGQILKMVRAELRRSP